MTKTRIDTQAVPWSDRPTQAVADVATMRPCLMCRQKFESAGFGERICRRCKSSTTWRNGNPGMSGKR